jgi:hypothetical protein
VDLDWNDEHCGECGNRCGDGTGTLACRDGACVTCEEAGEANCSGDCADLDWSDSHCGACDHACGTEEVCVLGQCISGDGSCEGACEDGNRICCDSVCINPRRSDNHCGGCNVARCGVQDCTDACRDGVCVAVDCGGGDD